MTKKVPVTIGLLLLAAATSFCAYRSHREAQAINPLAIANVEALTKEETQAEINARVHYQSNGLPNKRCPIWNISFSINPWGGTTIGCETGGIYKCDEGVCPHGI